jgi:hypothetical protein
LPRIPFDAPSKYFFSKKNLNAEGKRFTLDGGFLLPLLLPALHISCVTENGNTNLGDICNVTLTSYFGDE